MEGSTAEHREAEGARTQSLYRQVNERVRELNDAFSFIVPLGDWACECADPACSERIKLTQAEYEEIRFDPRRFAVAPGEHHYVPDIENLVEENERYWVVEKYGIAGDLAAKVDPRALSRERDRPFQPRRSARAAE